MNIDQALPMFETIFMWMDMVENFLANFSNIYLLNIDQVFKKVKTLF